MKRKIYSCARSSPKAVCSSSSGARDSGAAPTENRSSHEDQVPAAAGPCDTAAAESSAPVSNCPNILLETGGYEICDGKVGSDKPDSCDIKVEGD